ncbi:NAD-dependent epimerase/dehydratase family protein [Litorimonas haliclonae]|uniref:NAD-dependent epimerase/dehydratase family protein n=1 Tax=Litorimonas haliclonae TaxID=2081977 RepID=UPI0039F07E5F
MRVLLTGAAGFIGYHSAQSLLADGHEVIGVDNLNDYYDVGLKKARLNRLEAKKGFRSFELDIAKEGALEAALGSTKITHILNLAAQAGVRYSLENPRAYVASNVMGHLNILEYARHSDSLDHIAYASSSSVYGEREGGPFSESDIVRRPASLYAATKLGGEMLAESYAQLYKIPQTGLRFFTVYGPWGRPDMAYFIFTKKILAGEPITLFAPDIMSRDFTYVDDIVSIIPKLLANPPSGENIHNIYNLGNSRPNRLMDLVEAVETACGVKAQTFIKEQQKGDVTSTYADIHTASRDFGFKPKMNLQEGISNFVGWYRAFYGI